MVRTVISAAGGDLNKIKGGNIVCRKQSIFYIQKYRYTLREPYCLKYSAIVGVTFMT